jgi:hypothetical protein
VLLNRGANEVFVFSHNLLTAAGILVYRSGYSFASAFTTMRLHRFAKSTASAKPIKSLRRGVDDWFGGRSHR